MTPPNFFIIGATKSGTTSLYHYLSEHPEIYMSPVKEPAYFQYPGKMPPLIFPDELMSTHFKKNAGVHIQYPDLKPYLSLFEGVCDEKAIGEASPGYLNWGGTANAIYEASPHAKIIASFRNPFDAAYSEFLMNIRDGDWKEDISFMEVLKAENLEDRNLLSLPVLIRTRLYHQHITPYLQRFPKTQIHFLLFEDFQDTEKLLRGIFRFLEVSEDFMPDLSIKYNAGSHQHTHYPIHRLIDAMPLGFSKGLKKFIPKSLYAQYLNNWKGTQANIQPAKCPAEAKEFMRPYFRPDIKKLEETIERDLSHWLE